MSKKYINGFDLVDSQQGIVDYVESQRSRVNLYLKNPIRGTAAFIGLASTALMLGGYLMEIPTSSFVGAQGMLLAGLSYGSLKSKYNLNRRFSHVLGFTKNAINTVAGATGLFMLTFGHESTSQYLSNNMLNLGIMGTSALMAFGIANIAQGLKWNKIHEEYNKRILKKNNTQVATIKFEMYYHEKTAFFKKSDAAIREEQAQRKEAERQQALEEEKARITKEARIQEMQKALGMTGNFSDAEQEKNSLPSLSSVTGLDMNDNNTRASETNVTNAQKDILEKIKGVQENREQKQVSVETGDKKVTKASLKSFVENFEKEMPSLSAAEIDKKVQQIERMKEELSQGQVKKNVKTNKI